MSAVDILPYLEGITGKRQAVGKYRTGTVLALLTASSQKDVFSARFQREYAKIIEAEQPKPKKGRR